MAVAIAVAVAVAVASLAARSRTGRARRAALAGRPGAASRPARCRRGPRAGCRRGSGRRPAARRAAAGRRRASRSSTRRQRARQRRGTERRRAAGRRAARATSRPGDGAASTSPTRESAATHVRVLTVAAAATAGRCSSAARSSSTDSVLARLRLDPAARRARRRRAGGRCSAGSSRATSSRRSRASPRPRATSPQTEDLGRRIEVDEPATRSASWRRTSTRCSTRWRARSPPSASSSPTPRTSCARRSPRCARTSRCWPSARRCPPTSARGCWPTCEEQTTELGMLVADLIELARGDEPRREHRGRAARRARRRGASRGRAGTRRRSRSRRGLEPAVVEGTRERLARAVNNLLDNAAKHSPPAASSRSSPAPDGVRVRDHGSGVDPADLPHLFDRFYRGASARGRPGSGLGLAIVRQVAEQHGGSVSAENADGAVFRLRLSASPVPQEAPAALAGSDQHPLPAAPPRHRSPTGPPRT